MKYLVIQPDLVVKMPYYDADGTKKHKEQTLAHKVWLMGLVDDPELCKTPKDIRIAIKLEALLEDVKPGDVLSLEDTDYDRLNRVYEKPSGHYNPIVARASVKFMDAWEAATDKKPEPKEEEIAAETAPVPSNGATSEEQATA